MVVSFMRASGLEPRGRDCRLLVTQSDLNTADKPWMLSL